MPHTRCLRRLAICLLLGPALWACGATASSGDDSATTPGKGDVASVPDIDAGDAGGEPDSGADQSVGVDISIPCPNNCAGLGADPDKCQVAFCDKSTGNCKLIGADVGATCNDGKACTKGDACNVQGTCIGALACPVDGPCEQGACGIDGACVAHSRSGPCDDGNACTTGEACQVRACIGGKVVPCDDAKPCTTDVCQPDTGCVHLSASASQACDDDDPCTQIGTCDGAGGCTIGPPTTCDDEDPCTTDLCIPGPAADAGCKAVALPDGATCNDASKCTANDVCTDGKCAGGLIENAKPSTTCTTLLCDPKSAKITIEYAAVGTKCSDGAACTIADACAAGVCKGVAVVCNDGNACTAEVCDQSTGLCVATSVPDGGACDDGDGCTTSDVCAGGKCIGKSYQDTAQCDDKNPCTKDGCAPPSGCFHLPQGAIACDDGDGCTILDICLLDTCKGKPRPCDDGLSCTKDECAKGTCVHSPFLGPCDDGDMCTVDEVCLGAKCSGKPAQCDDGNACTKDGCAAKTGCTHVPLPGGTPCDDGLSCTLQDQCDGGACKGVDKCIGCANDLQCLAWQPSDPCLGKARCVKSFKGKVCAIDPTTKVVCADDGDPCKASHCDPKTGSCKTKLAAEGLPCSTPDKCLVGGTCTASGVCTGKALDCDDDNPCTIDGCSAKWGCSHGPQVDGKPCTAGGSKCLPQGQCLAGKCVGINDCKCKKDVDCVAFDDGNLCNGLMACVLGADGLNGFCEPAPNSAVSCPTPADKPCQAGVCNPDDGKCSFLPVPDGGACSDSSACTLKDKCKGGKCNGVALNCDGGDPCRIYVCDKVFGCNEGPKGDGGKCDDGNACTETDSCVGGKCQGKPAGCDDGNPCTIDLCNSKSGGCTSLVDNQAKCDDGDACTAGDGCVDGVCSAKQLACDDGDDCTIDGCDGQGGCKHILVPGKDCDDGDACTLVDTCDLAGKCQGKLKGCDDANACTAEQCVKGACVVTPQIGKKCDDNDACTHTDRCDPQGSCVSLPVNCDDGNPCTAVVGPCSVKKGCTVVPSDGKSCNDGNLCTIADKCAGAACQGIKLPCDDGNACTIDSCQPKTGCLNVQNTCSDGNHCTTDKCDPPPPVGTGKGCINGVINGFQPCDDGSKCTVGGVCNGLNCESKIVPCNDKNACTKDSCDSGKGCAHLPIASTALTCDDGDLCTTDHCDGKGKCIGTAKDCDDGNPCTQDACHPIKGCVATILKEGASCDDGCACTKGEQCQGGFCSGGKVVCPLCPKPGQGDCSVYDDNNLCNGAWTCVQDGPCGKISGISSGGGVCVAAVPKVVCDPLANSPCVKNTCDTLTGKCAPKALVNGSPCEDGVPCTVDDLCADGACASGKPADCSAVEDACNGSFCVSDPAADKGYQCVPLPKSGTSVHCDADGDGCTALDSCKQGKCTAGKSIDCQGVQGPCQVAACQSTGSSGFTCKLSPAKDGALCDDGQLCTVGDFCKGGKCQAGLEPPTCAAVESPCAKGVCDAKANGGTGACLPVPIAEGKPCDADGNGCTVGDVCGGGQCIPGSWPDCTAKTSACTLGACKSTGGGTWSCIASPTGDNKPCEADKNGCTVGDHCAAGQCVVGKLKDCSAFDGGGGCTVGTCVPLSASHGDCKGVAAPAGSACNADNSGCTVGDQCNKSGACVNGKAVDCLAFGSSCATGKCVPHPADPHKFSCQGAAKPDGTNCDADGDGCTVGDTCAAGLCKPGPAPDCSKQAKGACIVGGCANKGSDKYLCQPVTKADGAPCDADGDGCTTPDACVGGGCAKGPLQTCKKFGSMCADALCKSGGANAFDCLVAPKASWPGLDPPQSCTPTDPKPDCPVNYKCAPQNKQGAGFCEPVATIACDDGDPCTGGDVCASGKCAAGAALNCDDGDACTLDFCQAGKCAHKSIAGCSICVDEGFDVTVAPGVKPKLPPTWVSIPDRPDYADFKLSDVQTWANSKLAMRATWKGPHPDAAGKQLSGHLRHRRLYLHGPTTLQFRLAMTVANESCTRDNLEVLVNDVVVWKRCGKSDPMKVQVGFEAVVVDLSKWAGAPVDLAFRIDAGTDKSAGGTVVLDAIKLSGGCGPACVGEDFEAGPPADGVGGGSPPRMPQPWRLQASASSWLSWKLDDKAGHTGKASLRASWTGKAPAGKAQTARLQLPMITPAPGDILRLALRAQGLDDPSCAADRLAVLVNGSTVLQRCNDLPGWKVFAIPLTPWAGKTVTVEVLADVTASKGGTGALAIDDVAISGACSWACFHETFDADGLVAWKPVDGAAKGVAWQLGKTLAASKPHAARGLVSAAAKVKTSGHLIARVNKGGRLPIPVMGATYTYAANVAMQVGPEGKANVCAGPGKLAPEWPLVLALQHTDQPTPAGAHPGAGEQLSYLLNGHCTATSGWQKFSGAIDFKTGDDLPGGPRGLSLVPAFDLRVTQAPSKIEAWIDDLLITCK